MTHFGRRKILDAISQIIADEGRKVGLFLPEKKTFERLSIDIVEKTSKILIKIDVRTQN